MSLSISTKVDEQFPVLLATNTASSAHQFIVHVIAALRAQGRTAFHVCKTVGDEGQYAPPGFTPLEVKGFNGRTYLVTGVSPDTVWCDENLFLAVAGADAHPTPASPAWDLIDQDFWRPNNPPLPVSR